MLQSRRGGVPLERLANVVNWFWNRLKSFWYFFTAATKKFAKDHLAAYAAQSTFYLMLSFFPFVMLLCMATRLLPLEESTLLAMARLVLPEDYHELGLNLIDGYYNENISSAKFFLILFLVWTAARLIQALINGFNTAYGITETRSQMLLRFISCAYTIALCAMMVAMTLMYALGSRLVHFCVGLLPASTAVDVVLSIIRNLATPLLLLGVFWLSYVILPSRKTKFLDELPGAVFSAIIWRGAVELFSVFISQSMRNYSYVYGSLTGLIMLLVWLYTCVYFWFVGAELNWYLKDKREKKLLPMHD